MKSSIMIITLAATSVVIMFATSVRSQRPVPMSSIAGRPTGSGGAQFRSNSVPLELESHQPMPQPFRRVSLPLYRGRGFSTDGQESKPALLLAQQQQQQQQQQTSQSRPLLSLENNDNEFNRVENTEDTTDVPQQRIDRFQQLADRNQQSDKQFPSFGSQPQSQHVVEPQPQFVRKVVQKPLKRVHVTSEETATSRSPESVQRLKLERSESADKQRAKKPVSQVLKRYRDDNPDGSITWGYENDDGTFKEETIGVDCVTRGKYGYIDPEGVKREYSYQSGVPCDKDRKPYATATDRSSSAVQEAQASDTYGYIDYTKNQYVMANGQTIDLNGMAKNRARKPVVRKTTTAATAAHWQ